MELLDTVANAILTEAREEGADSPVDYGDAEQLAICVLAIPEIAEALAHKREYDALKLGGE